MSQTLSTRRSGSLTVYREDPPEAPAGPREPYARFRVCRGFLDDLNHILPIRMRIRIESEIAQGSAAGHAEGPGAGPGFRWEFVPG